MGGSGCKSDPIFAAIRRLLANHIFFASLCINLSSLSWRSKGNLLHKNCSLTVNSLLKILQIKDVRSVKDSVRLLMGKLPREIGVVFNTKERKSKKSLTEQTYDYFSNGFLSTMKDKLQESTFIKE